MTRQALIDLGWYAWAFVVSYVLVDHAVRGLVRAFRRRS